MRRFSIFALIVAGSCLASACDGPERTNPLQVGPSFGKVDLGCEALSQPLSDGYFATKAELLEEIHLNIDELFLDRKSVNSAHSHIDNVARKVCDGDYVAATKMAWSFLEQVEQQVAGEFTRLAPPYSGLASDLSTETFLLACDPTGDGCIEIPEGAFWPTGGIGIVDPDDGGTVTTRNLEAAAEVAPGDFESSPDPVFLVFWRTFDHEVSIPGYWAVPEGYQILSSETPVQDGGDGVLVQMCVLLTEEVVNAGILDRLKLGHDLGDGTVHLLDRVTDGLTIDCTDAADFLEPPTVASSWLQSLTRWAGATFQQILLPNPLFGDIIGGVGLGGRTKSFSPFAPVDPYGTLTLTIENSSSAPVMVTGSSDFTCEGSSGNTSTICTADYPVGTEVTLSADFQEVTDFAGWSGCTANGDGTCSFTMMAGGAQVTAGFQQAVRTLTLDVFNESAASVQVLDGLGFVCEAAAGSSPTTCTNDYPVGAPLSLTQSLDPLLYEFGGWAGDCSLAADGSCEVVMGLNGATVSATFLARKETLEIGLENRVPKSDLFEVRLGNQVVCSAAPDTGWQACAQSITPGQEVTLTAWAIGVTWNHDIWIDGADGQCTIHYLGPAAEPASCTFAMPTGSTRIEFRLTDGG